MSVVSQQTRLSRVSRNSSILKKSTSIKKRISEITSTPTKVRFTLPHSKKVRNILHTYLTTKERRDYDHLLCTIRDSELFESDVLSLLREAIGCISLLNKELKLFVEALVTIQWVDFSEEVTSQYQSFVTHLVTAHNEHAKTVIDALVNLFIEVGSDTEWPEGQILAVDSKRYIKVHTVINSLVSLVPLCGPLIMPIITTKYPYHRRPAHIQEHYLHNLLWLMKYIDPIRTDILYLIISKLVIMDVNAPKEKLQQKEKEQDEEMFLMEVDARSTTPAAVDGHNIMAHNLDVCLNQIFDHLLQECFNTSTGELNWEVAKSLFKNMLNIFDDVILSTYNIHHVQFIMFFLCSFKETFADTFLNYLWMKVCNPSVAAVLRQSAVAYIASLVARATYIPLKMLKGTLQDMSSWIHTYITNQDAVECVNPDIRAHLVFYTVCQSLFYVVAFRHKDLVTKKKNIVFLESLNLGKIVTSRLNPLRVCQPAVAQNFAAVTRKYQLAYCYTVMEHNARNVMPMIYQDEKAGTVICSSSLEGYFPFDPYVLPRSINKIQPHYRDYTECTEMSANNRKEVDEVDDFLDSVVDFNSSASKSLTKFSYGSSPGFKFKN